MADRNPDWTEEELILALDVWIKIRTSDRAIPKDHPLILKVSDDLRRLPIHPESSRNSEFRDPDGVRRRVGYFRQLDEGKEFSGRHLYRSVWEQYSSDIDLLRVRKEEILTQLEGDKSE